MAPVLALAGGRYALGDVLGRGGMAQVRQATDTVLGREVAIKLFREDLDEQAAARIRTEMQTLARLSHPGLVGVHDAGTERDLAGVDHPFLVMELVEGPTLADCCRDGALPAERVRRIGAELAAALAYVHECGVVHRDVKPANILLSPTGAKLADFGIARIVDAARHTGTGLTVGTAPYLAPEQVTGDPIGPAADVYALGLVLLECLTGRREYDGSSVETALARLHRQPVVPPDLGAPWPGLLARMTARAPAQRPTAQEVAAALVLPADLAPTDRTAVMASRPPAAATWTVGVAAAVALVAVILLAAGAAQGSSSVRTSPVRVTPSATLAPAGRVLKPVVHPTAHVSPVVGRHGKAKGHQKHD